MEKKYAVLGLLTVMALAVFFRFWQIDSIPPGFYPDEAIYANNALEAWETGKFKIFYPENNGREGLWINIIAPFLAVFGNEPWASRSAAAAFGILTALGLYLLARELFSGKSIALLASFFLTVSFWHINFSRIGFRAILAPFFLVWSFYLLFKVANKVGKENPKSEIVNPKQYQNPNVQNPKPFRIFDFRNWDLFRNSDLEIRISTILSGLLFGLGFHTYIAYRVAPLLLIIPFYKMWKSGQKNLILIFLLFAFIAALPLGIYFLQNPQDFFGRASQVSIFAAENPLRALGLNIVKTVGMFFYRGDYNWRHNLSGAPQLWWPVAILFLIGILISIKGIFKNPKSEILNPKQYQNQNDQNSKRFRILNLKNWNLFENWKLSARGGSAFGGKIENLKGSILSTEGFLFSWIVIMLIPAIVSSEGLPHALRAIVAIPPVMIFSALGLNWIIIKISNLLNKKIEQYPENLKQFLRLKKQLTVLLLAFLLAVAANTYNQYFCRWAGSPYVADAFSANYAELGKYLNTLPRKLDKYVIVNVEGVDVYGIPMPAQTVMFITKTYLPKWQKEKKIHYVNVVNKKWEDLEPFIQEISQKEHFVVTMLEIDPYLRKFLKEKIPSLNSETKDGLIVLEK
jgi:4-amino-4-deoxy-L-arabinose transferase-like glycosyltransferase